MENETKVLTIAEMEQRTAEKPKFGSGITLASGFDLGSKAALDSRSTVKTIAERDDHVTGNRAYTGMAVYVEENDTRYVYTSKGTWKVDGFNQEDLQQNIVNDLTTGGATVALSAEQGKVLKGMVDATQGEIDALEGVVSTEVTRLEESIATKAAKSGSLDQDFNAKTVVITGDLTVQGTTTSIETVNLEIKDNQIIINKGEEGAGVTSGVAGVRVERGTETDYLFQFNEEEDMFQVGMEGDLETVATRPYLATELDKVTTVIEANKTVLDEEVARAKAEEAKIREEFVAVDVIVTEAIESEATRAKAEEAKLQGNIDLKVAKDDVINTLETSEETLGKVLDARQGKVLKEAIDVTQAEVDAVEVRVATVETGLVGVDGKLNTVKTEAIKASKDYTDVEIAKLSALDHTHTIADVTGLTEKHTAIDGEITALKAADTTMGEKVTSLETSTADLGQIRTNISTNASGLAQEILDRTGADTALGGRIDTLNTTVETKASKDELTTGLATKVNVSDLMAGDKINASLMPALAISETFPVKTEEEMLALTAQSGDIAIRSDLSKTFILSGNDASVLENWIPLLTPASAVTSVAGKKGDVVLNKADVGLANVTNESKETMFTSPVFTGNATSVTVDKADNSTSIATTAYVKAQGYLTQESIIDGGTF